MAHWNPILLPSTETARRGWETVDAIAQAVRTRSYPPPTQRTRTHRPYEEALLYGYLSMAYGDEQWIEWAAEQLNIEINRVPQVKSGSGLYGGKAGLGWTVEHLGRVLADGGSAGDTVDDDEQDVDVGAELDEVLRAEVKGCAWANYDLISGLVGVGVYFLERWPLGRAAEGIRAVLDSLERIAETSDAGVTWFSGPALLPEWQRAIHPNGYYNLGVAHGIPGIIYFLCEAAAAGVEADRAGRLLNGAVRWLLAHQRPPGSKSRFSSWIADGESRDSRLAWCYGDLGILGVMTHVSRRTGRQDWVEFSEGLLDHCLAWPIATSGIADAPLCHGAAGNAQVFNRIYQSTGDERCKTAAVKWLELALDMRRPGEGVGGILSLTKPDGSPEIVWEPSPAFLDGAIGVALALVAALTPVQPQWDRLLLLSGRSFEDG